MRLEDRTIVITGAASGIGRALALRFAGERPRGLDIGLPGANKALLERLVERGGLKGGAWGALVPLLLALLLLLAHRPLGFTARVAHEVDRPTPTRARARRGVD
jgi:NAD(P)-dependent dehydrogenase (short-subunit alcohol dehydrogenase family)